MVLAMAEKTMKLRQKCKSKKHNIRKLTFTHKKRISKLNGKYKAEQ